MTIRSSFLLLSLLQASPECLNGKAKQSLDDCNGALSRVARMNGIDLSAGKWDQERLRICPQFSQNHFDHYSSGDQEFIAVIYSAQSIFVYCHFVEAIRAAKARGLAGKRNSSMN